MDDYVTGDIFTFNPPQQTLSAWAPFWDCVSILFNFRTSEISDGDEEYVEWRLFWVAGVALLRTVGHVLAKVDTNASEEHAQAIASWWKQIRSNKENSWIFWQFIEKERNNLLKTYTFGAQFSLHGDEAKIIFEDGEDAFERFREAVYWWRHQLLTLEGQLSEITFD
ncbi:hypothetical protein [Nisaea sp.]|uniref:hypothetical protein n=1 Tax=Nisaea sp. TaxID=2024842 RepID=UPI003264628F